MNRESIAAAVFSKLSGISGVVTSSRRPKSFDQVEPSACPAVFLGVGSSENLGDPTGQSLWRMEFIVYLYVNDGGASGPSSTLNTYIGKIESAFRASSSDAAPGFDIDSTTLGGLVLYAKPTRIETDEGSFGDQGVAILTIEVLTAG